MKSQKHNLGVLFFLLMSLSFPVLSLADENAAVLEKTVAAEDHARMEWEGHASKQEAEFIKVVETKGEWAELWKRAFDQPAPELDFEKYVAACVFLGHSADWLYSIDFGQPFMREGQLVIPYRLYELVLELAGPFKASGQYYMKAFEKKKDVKMILEPALRPFE